MRCVIGIFIEKDNVYVVIRKSFTFSVTSSSNVWFNQSLMWKMTTLIMMMLFFPSLRISLYFIFTIFILYLQQPIKYYHDVIYDIYLKISCLFIFASKQHLTLNCNFVVSKRNISLSLIKLYLNINKNSKR